MTGPDVSVIVPFHNTERYLGALLDSLTAQTLDRPWEIVAVDNLSTDRSRAVVEPYLSRLPLSVVEARARAHMSYARNVGVRHSVGRKLVFIDADDEVDAGYVGAISRALETHRFVTSRVDSVALNPDWVRGAHGPAWQTEEVGVFYDFLPAAGSNIGIHRDLYEAIGGFPEEFGPCADIAFSWRAQILAASRPQFVSDAVYRYRYRDSLRGLFHQGLSWGAESVLLYRRYRDEGMPRRSTRVALREWRTTLGELARARDRATRAPLVVRLGLCVGRLQGSLRQRLAYL